MGAPSVLHLSIYRTPFILAVKGKNNYEAVRLLLDHDADTNHQDITGGTALHGFFNETVRTLIELYQDDIEINSRDSYGMSIAHWVCRSKSSLPIDLQRCYNADPALIEAPDDNGRTPLYYACQRGNIAIIEKLLLETNRGSSSADWEGRTPMNYATESGRSAQVIDVLAREGFDVHATDDHDRIVLHHAAETGKVAAVEKLLKIGAGADLDTVDMDNRTPLQLAAWCGRTAVVDRLRELCTNGQDLELPEEQILELSTCQPKAFRNSSPAPYIRTMLDTLGAFVLFWVVLQLWMVSKTKM